MVESLADRLDNFPGAASQTRCFLHILNLTAKSVIRQLEVPKKKRSKEDGQDNDDDNFTEAMEALQALSVEIEDDEPSDDVASDKDGEEDNDEGLEDERQGMTEEEIDELEAELLPARRMLTKVPT
jgi:hypothetical protein